MANRFWVGGTGNWSNASTTNWSATSGGASGASAPTFADDVFFDANSNTGTNPFTVTILANATCRAWDVSGLDGLMTIAGSTTSFFVFGGIFFSGFNLTSTFTGIINLRGTSGTFFITTNGVALSSFVVNCTASYRLGGNITLDGNTYANINLVSGTFNVNGWTANLTGTNVNNITGSGSISRALTLTSSIVNCYSTSSPINLGGSNYSIGTSGSTVNIYGSSASITQSIAGSYNYVYFQAPSAIGTRSLATGSSFNTLRVDTGFAAGIYPFTVSGNIAVSSLQLLGSINPAIRHSFLSNVDGTQRTLLSTSSFLLQNVDFKDIASSSTVWSGTSIATLSNTANITASSAKTVYWNLAGTQNWSATGWATSSGGVPAVANFPIAQDTVVFDNTGAAGTITVDANYNIFTLSTSARTLPVTINVSVFLYLFRNLTLGSGLTSSGTLIFTGSSIATITSNGNTTNFNIRWEKNSGTIGGISSGAFLSTNDFTVNSGTFQTGGNNVTVRGFYTGSNTKILSFSSSTITITGSGEVCNLTGSNTTFSSNTATLSFNSASAKQFRSVTAFSFSSLIQNGAGALSMLGVLCTNISTNVRPTTINFYGTNTFTNFNLNGTPGNLVTLGNANSFFAGNTYSIRAVIVTSSPSTLKILDYVNVSGLQFESPINGVNYVGFYATNSINSGNNQGILFSDTSKKIFYIVGNTSFVLPNDWNPNNNRIFLVGAGGSGGQSFNTSSGGGGGGGGFTLVQNYAAPPGATVSYNVGVGGYYSGGGNTTWASSGYPTHSANGGGAAPSSTFPYNAGGTGGTGSTFNGGNGGNGIAYVGNTNFTLGGGGGGGSGGSLGNGAVGGNGFQSSFSSTNNAGGGGGGSGGGSAGQNGTSSTGGAGGNNASGVGGGAASSGITNVGFAGGGGSGSVGFATSSGQSIPSTGSDIAGSFGTGGGAGGSGSFTGNTALFDFGNSANGAGGGGGGYYFGGTYNPGQGGNGIIVVEYTPNTDFLMFMNAR